MKRGKINNILKKLSPSGLFYGIISWISQNFRGKVGAGMCNTIDILKKIYGESVLPVAVTDGKMEFLWKNRAAEGSEIFFRRTADFLDGKACGQVCAEVGGIERQFNVIKYNAESVYYIIEHLGNRSVAKADPMRNYFTYLSARIRDAATDIANASDNIVMSVADDDDAVAGSLNRINRQIMMLLNEVNVPEQIYYNTDPFFRDEHIDIEAELTYAAEDAKNALDGACEVSVKCGEEIFANINRSTFEVIIAFITAEACGGEFFPDRLEFASEKISEGRAAISVRGVNVSGRVNTPLKFAGLKSTAGYFDGQLEKLISQRYGAEISKAVQHNGVTMRMEFNALSNGRVIVRNGVRYNLREERFTAMACSLAERHMPERYKITSKKKS